VRACATPLGCRQAVHQPAAHVSSARVRPAGAGRRPNRVASARAARAARAAPRACVPPGPASARGRRAGKENAFADLPHSLEAMEVDGAAQPLGLAEPVHKVWRRRAAQKQPAACKGAVCAASGCHSCTGGQTGDVQVHTLHNTGLMLSSHARHTAGGRARSTWCSGRGCLRLVRDPPKHCMRAASVPGTRMSHRRTRPATHRAAIRSRRARAARGRQSVGYPTLT
jgi:hypothetical protein